MVRLLLRRHGHDCWLCGKHIEHADMTLDHVIPLSRGGKTTPGNLRLAHAKCNVRRGNGSAWS